MDFTVVTSQRASLTIVLFAIVAILTGCGGSSGSGDFLGGAAPTPVPTLAPPAPAPSVPTLSNSQKASVAFHIEDFSSKPASVASFYQQATLTTKDFMSEVTNRHNSPGRRLKVDDIIAAVSVIGVQLFKGLELLIPDDLKSTDYFSQLKTAWMNLFENLADESAEIRASIEEYLDEVKPGALVQVINECMKKAKELIKAFFPTELYEKIGKYLDGVVAMFGGFAEGWSLIDMFEQVDGVVAIYDGVRAGLDSVLPDNLKADDGTYVAIMGFLDEVVGDLSEHVAMFTKRLRENKACWRRKLNREDQPAQVCPVDDGYYWDGVWQCLHDEKSSRPALCDAASDFKTLLGEDRNRRCYKDCDSGLHPWEDNEEKCVTTCAGNRSVSGKMSIFSTWEDMCGADAFVLGQIQNKILAKTTHAIITLVESIVEMVEKKKFIGSSMNKTIKAILEFAAEFVFPHCDDASEDGSGR